MLSFINKEYFKEISGYDIEIINLNLRGEVNERRIKFVVQHLNFELEEAYLSFLKDNIAVVFKTNDTEEKMIYLYYAYEVVSRNLANEIYEKYSLNATIVGRVVYKDQSEKNILIMNNEEQYGVFLVDTEENIIKIGESFQDVFTMGKGVENF